MKDLPTSWIQIEIEHVLGLLDNGNVIQQGWSPQCERTPSKNENSWGVLKTTAIQEGYFLPEENKKLPDKLEPRPHIEVRAGDTLMTCAGPRNRCGVTCLVRITRKQLMMSGKMYRFRANPKIINPKYLEAYLISQDAKYSIDRMKTGINDSGLNLTHSRFKKLLIPLPPLHEQQRITDKIDELLSELDNSIRSLSKALSQMSLLYNTVLNDAFKKVEEVRLLKDLLSVKLSNGYSGKPVKHKTEYKVLSLSSTTSGIFKDEYFKFLDEKGLRCRDIWCKPNDILIQRGNTIEYVGVPAIFTGAPETFIFPDLMIRVKAHEDIVTAKYLYYALSSPKIRNYLRSKAKGSAGTMPKINQATLNTAQIPYIPISEQKQLVQEIEEKLSICTFLEGLIQDNLVKTNVLRQSILKKAFSGQLVEQGTNEEPASVLLERIKAEKAKQAEPCKKKKRKTAA